jgi:hypothetical protein
VQNLQAVVDTFHSALPLATPKHFDTTVAHSYQDHFDEQLVSATASMERTARKQQAEARKADASEEQALLIDIGEQLLLCQGASGKTALDKLNDGLRHAWDTVMNMNDSERIELRRLAEQASTIDNKKIQKICKKLLEGLQ